MQASTSGTALPPHGPMRCRSAITRGGALALLAKGWTSNMILFWQSGAAFEVTNAWPNANGVPQINLPTITTDRPTVVAGQRYKASNASLPNWLNLNPFTSQPAST